MLAIPFSETTPQIAGFSSPIDDAGVRLLMAGIRGRLGTAATAKRPVLVADLQAMVAAVPGNLLGLRDRAILLLGFSGAFRRSELAALNSEDLLETADGLVVTLRRSKTDQEAEGRKVAIPRGREAGTCPVGALSAWLTAAGIVTGPLFRRVNRHGQILPHRLSGPNAFRAPTPFGRRRRDCRQALGHRRWFRGGRIRGSQPSRGSRHLGRHRR